MFKEVFFPKAKANGLESLLLSLISLVERIDKYELASFSLKKASNSPFSQSPDISGGEFGRQPPRQISVNEIPKR